ncbi:MAG: hypothetical protein R2729_21010 [Bryobacteraceae bacterium]
MRRLSAVFLLPGLLSAGTASGTMTLNGQAIAVKHAYAVQIPDWFDKTKMATRLVVSDSPMAETALHDEIELMRLAREGGVNALQFEIGAERSSLSLSILSAKIEGSLSSSRSFDAATIPVFTASRIEGSLSIEPKTLGSMTYAYDVKFAADIAPKLVKTPPAAPTAADTAAAIKSASGKAYLAWVAALRAGDKAKLMALASPEVGRMIDQPDFADKLELVKAMMPSEIKVLKATETGDDATLAVSGLQDGQKQNGTITMKRTGGKWGLVKESWRGGQE